MVLHIEEASLQARPVQLLRGRCFGVRCLFVTVLRASHCTSASTATRTCPVATSALKESNKGGGHVCSISELRLAL